jgi:hypothetical protein
VLRFQGVLALFFSVSAHLLGYGSLLLCLDTLLVTDAALLIGNLLHLLIDALHHGSALLLLAEDSYPLLQLLRLLLFCCIPVLDYRQCHAHSKGYTDGY